MIPLSSLIWISFWNRHCKSTDGIAHDSFLIVTSVNLPSIKLNQGIHVMHLFYRVDRVRWAKLPAGESEQIRIRLESLCTANSAPSHPRLTTYTNIGGKADLVFM